MTMKEKRFNFFADTQEGKAENQPTFGTTCSDLSELPFAQHTSQRFAKVKEPNFPYAFFDSVQPNRFVFHIKYLVEKHYICMSNILVNMSLKHHITFCNVPSATKNDDLEGAFSGFYLVILFLLCILFPTFSFSQARFNIFNGVYATMGGGTSSSPVYLVVENGNANAISRSGNGHIISENEYNKIKWFIGTNTGIYLFHLGKGTTDYMPFYLNKTTSGTCPTPPCSYTVSSYYTLNNALLPSGVTNVNPGENSAIDRFWVIDLSGYTSNPTADIRFYYIDNPTELDGIPESNLQAQRWSSGAWQSPVGIVDITNNYVEITSVSQFSPWTLVDRTNPLPIELLTFTAEWKDKEQTSALLKWTTATETNNDYFNIERSKDGIVFEKIGTIKGAGNSSSIRNYEFVDTDLPISTSIFYYRLKQVDYDGKNSYSNIIALSRENILNIISVFPNPANDFVNILLSSSEESNAEITITNTLSQTILNEKVIMQKGLNKYSFNVSPLAKGVYTIKVSQNNHTTIYNLVTN